VNALKFSLIAIGVGLLVSAFAHWLKLDYFYFAGYTILQFIVLATAWNVLGGYCGYVNFGSAAFFALGAYSTVFLHKLYPLPIPVLIVIGAVVSGIVGFGMGYLTLRLRGAFFAIATPPRSSSLSIDSRARGPRRHERGRQRDLLGPPGRRRRFHGARAFGAKHGSERSAV
jgi:hypothetical protein